MLKIRIRGKDKFETWENVLMTILLFGCVLLSVGIGMTTFSSTGVPVILAMGGSFVTFCSTIALIILWLIKEVR